MRQLSFPGVALVVLALALPGVAQAQEPAQAPAQKPAPAASQPLVVPEISEQKMAVYASAYTEIANVRDQYHAEFARTANKTHEIQAELRKKLKEEVAKIIQEKGLTEEEYDRITWVVSVDPKQREALTAALARQRGGGSDR